MNKFLNISSLIKKEFVIFSSIFLISLFLRLFDISSRAMHHDESLHVFYSWKLFEGLGYSHNPMMHGPLQMELTSIIFSVIGDSDFSSRLLYVACGSLLVVMPYFLIKHINLIPCILISLFLAVSPTITYFTRFARNDVLMNLFSVILIILIWNYLSNRNSKNLYFISLILALIFGTKESSYLIIFMLVSFNLLNIGYLGFFHFKIKTYSNYFSFSELTIIQITSGISKETIKVFKNSLMNRTNNNYVSITLLLVSITLPLWAAFSGIIFNFLPLEINLVSHEINSGIGLPDEKNRVLAIFITGFLFFISILIGVRWGQLVWIKCSILFWLIWTVIYTTFFTNITDGIYKGLWQSLGYWIVQQGEGRGNQPFYYYFILSSIYELAVMIISVLAIIYYIKIKKIKPTDFTFFLIFWVISSWTVYTLASEKMPWLLFNITVPMIFLSGKLLGDILITLNSKRKTVYKSILICAICIILIFNLWITYRVNFINSDIPKEMLVYTQTSPDLKSISDAINTYKKSSNEETNILIDTTSGFVWPWVWYLRDNNNVAYKNLKSEGLDQSNLDVLIIHSMNVSKLSTQINQEFEDPIVFPHRWWFPESTYRDLNFSTITNVIFEPQKIVKLFDYLIFANGISDKIGSEDAYLYFKSDFPDVTIISQNLK